MGDTFAILGLRRKRAELAGQVIQAEAHYLRLSAALRALDMTLRLFDDTAIPEAIKPRIQRGRRTTFEHGELSQAIRDVLRRADRPLTTPEVAVQIAGGRGMDVEDKAAMRKLAQAVRESLVRADRGIVRGKLGDTATWTVRRGELRA